MVLPDRRIDWPADHARFVPFDIISAKKHNFNTRVSFLELIRQVTFWFVYFNMKLVFPSLFNTVES